MGIDSSIEPARTISSRMMASILFRTRIPIGIMV